MRTTLTLLLSFFCCSFQAQHCGVLYVNANAAGANTGASWPDAYASLQDALAAAANCPDGAEIWVAQGTYFPDQGAEQAVGSRGTFFQLLNKMALFGGFAGTETERSQRDWAAHPTILSGDIGLPGDSTDNCYTVVVAIDVDSTAQLDGFVIKDGNADASSGLVIEFYGRGNTGGGLYSLRSDLRILNCRFANNSARYRGGGIYDNGDGGDILIKNTIFSNNQSFRGEGGGCYFSAYSNLVLEDVAFEDNFAYRFGGGGLYYGGGGTARLKGCIFKNNHCRHSGGGMYARGTTILENCLFEENRASRGGAIDNGNVLNMENCIIKGNAAGSLGGGIINTRDLSMYNCLLAGNTGYNGGAINSYGSNATITLVNCTLSGNQAENLGGAIRCEDTDFPSRLENCIVWGNKALDYGNQFYINSNVQMNLVNSCYANAPGDIGGSGAFTADANSIAANPLFIAPLPPEEAPTAGGDYRLGPCSPAINAGDNSLLPPEFSEDLGYNPRFVGTAVDMGAYEVQDTHNIQPLAVEVMAAVPSCFGYSDGSLAVSVSGGAPPYTILWNTGQEGPAISGLAPGDYTAAVTDAQGCSHPVAATLEAPPALEIQAIVLQEPSCYGHSGGQAAVSAEGGQAPYAYAWSNGQPTATADSLPAGWHRVTLTDANGCTAVDSVFLSQPDSLETAAWETQSASCSDAADGTAIIQAAGGTPPYQYLWENGQTAGSAGGLAAGLHPVTVTDANGCTASTVAKISAPLALQLEVAPVHPLCAGLYGEATAAASGGTLPYQFLWSGGQEGPAAAGLQAGTHSVTVTDARGCKAAEAALITEPPALLLDTLSTQLAGCGGNSGQATVQALGGHAPYSYQWSNGQSGPQAAALAAGAYSATATDSNGCQATVSVLIDGAEPLALDSAALQSPACSNSADGQIELEVSGGAPPLAFVWSAGQEGAVAAGLGPGLHSVTVTDEAGCMLVDSFTLQAAYQFMIGINMLSPVDCRGDSTAAVRAVPAGGVGPFSYLWNTGQATAEITSLPAGAYSVTITDANGCTASGGVTAPDPPVLAVGLELFPPSCADSGDGRITALASGGTPPYTYQWSNGLAGAEAGSLLPGTYQATVADANGCEVAVTVDIPALPFEPGLFIEQEGNTLTVAEEDTAHYRFQWINCDTGEEIPGAIHPWNTFTENGNYKVIVTDISGACRNSSECVTLTVTSTEEPTNTSQNATAFPNPNDGRFTLALPWAAEACLHDASGRLLLCQNYGTGNHQVNMGELPPGLYILALKRPEGVQVLRLVLK